MNALRRPRTLARASGPRRRSVRALAGVLGFLLSACRSGDLRSDDEIVGAWCMENQPVYFHPSRWVDADGLSEFPRVWYRDAEGRLRFDEFVVDEQKAPGSLTLRWDGKIRTLRRTDYLVVRDDDRDAGVCPPR